VTAKRQPARRFVVLAWTSGTFTARPAGSAQPAGAAVVAQVNRPLTDKTAPAAYRALMHAQPGRF
jgi:hypothetical protein